MSTGVSRTMTLAITIDRDISHHQVRGREAVASLVVFTGPFRPLAIQEDPHRPAL